MALKLVLTFENIVLQNLQIMVTGQIFLVRLLKYRYVKTIASE